MNSGFSFLKSKLARRFCTLFILCAFIPVLILTVLSYTRVVDELEEQSFTRLKREASAYGLSLFDRLIRVENELRHISRNILVGYGEFVFSDESQRENVATMLRSISQYLPDGQTTTVYGSLEPDIFAGIVQPEYLQSQKAFLMTRPGDSLTDRVFMGVNFSFADGSQGVMIGELIPDFLWGTGANPLLPPMTDLLVFDAAGEPIVATTRANPGSYRGLEKVHDSEDMHIFRFTLDGEEFLGSFSNLFIESRYQRTGWVIVLAQARDDIMSALEHFSTTYPFIMLLFLLLILYLSVKFIRKALLPLEALKTATQRIARQNFTSQVEIEGDDEFAELGTAFNTMSRTIEQQFHTMETIGEIDRAILSATDRITILKTTLHRLKAFFACDIALYTRTSESSRDFIKVYILKGRRAGDPYIEYFSIEQSGREQLFAADPHSTLSRDRGLPAFLTDNVDETITSYLVLPIAADDGVERSLLLGWQKARALSDDELGQARQIANQFAVALANSQLLANLEKLASGTIEALARTVDAKSRWTSGHSERVADLAARIAQTMGCDEQQVTIIRRGGLMHDIGKIGIPLAILDKPERLTDEEYREIKHHPSIGAKILEPIDAFRNILTVVEQHHEKFDGSGYPNGLAGEEIDLNARILAVADVWDALVSARPYRDGWVHARARKLITEGSGSHFDPQVVTAFLAIMDS